MDPHAFEGHVCSPALRLDILRRVPFFVDLNDDDLARIDEHFHERGYAPGETVFSAGDEAKELFITATGELRLLHHTPQGRNVLLDVLVPGEFFGALPLLGHEVQVDTVTAHTPCCLLAAGSDEVRRILERHPTVALRVLEHVAGRLRDAHEHVRHLAASSAEGRLAAMLVRLAAKLGDPGEGAGTRIPLSQQDLAEMAGTTLETVNRTLRRFRDEGLVRTGRGWVLVAHPERLEAVAERIVDG